MAALLTSVGDDKDKRPIYLAECRRWALLLPDVNESSADFTAVGTDIRFGLASVRNVGHNVVEAIVRAREDQGAFKDFPTSCARSRRWPATRRSSSRCVQGRCSTPRLPPSGPGLGPRRCGRQRDGAQAQGGRGAFDLFGGFGGDGGVDDPFGGALDLAIPTADWSKSERLALERDMLGLYVFDHLLHGVEHVLTSHADTPIAEINAGGVEDGANVTIAGILTAVGPRTNKQGARGRSPRWRTSSPASRCCSS